MVGIRKHIEGLDLLHGVSAADKGMQISCQRFGGAGDVNDAVRGKREERLQEFRLQHKEVFFNGFEG